MPSVSHVAIQIVYCKQHSELPIDTSLIQLIFCALKYGLIITSTTEFLPISVQEALLIVFSWSSLEALIKIHFSGF